MNDFKTAYKKETDKIAAIHIDINTVLDEGRRKRLARKKRKRMAIEMAVAATVLFLTTFGSVQAAEYLRNVIRVSETGFRSGDAVTMAAAGSESGDGQEADHMRTMEAEAIEELQDMTQTEEMVVEGYNPATADMEMLKMREYDSLAAFFEEEEAVLSLPVIEAEIESEHVWADEMMVSVRLQLGEKSIIIDRMDYSKSQGHASSSVYAGGVENERSYTTAQGFSYILVDSQSQKISDQEDKLQEAQPQEEMVQSKMPLLEEKQTAAKEESALPDIHAAVTVGAYEIYVDFSGFEAAEAEQILESMDLTVYQSTEGGS